MGDESYAGSRSFDGLEKTIKNLMGFKYVAPTHQGRAAENIPIAALLGLGQYVVGNTQFDSTMAHIIVKHGILVNMSVPETLETLICHPFKEIADLQKLDPFLKE